MASGSYHGGPFTTIAGLILAVVALIGIAWAVLSWLARLVWGLFQ